MDADDDFLQFFWLAQHKILDLYNIMGSLSLIQGQAVIWRFWGRGNSTEGQSSPLDGASMAELFTRVPSN